MYVTLILSVIVSNYTHLITYANMYMHIAKIFFVPIAKYMWLLQLDNVTQSLSIATHDCRYVNGACSYCTQLHGYKQIRTVLQ